MESVDAGARKLTRGQFVEFMNDFDACDDAREWFAQHPDRDLAWLWDNCPDGMWLMWVFEQVSGCYGIAPDELIRICRRVEKAWDEANAAARASMPGLGLAGFWKLIARPLADSIRRIATLDDAERAALLAIDHGPYYDDDDGDFYEDEDWGEEGYFDYA